MLADELRDALLAVPGVASAQVAESEGAKPVVRVWLDGSRRGVDVEREVNRLIALSGYQTTDVVPAATEPPEPPPMRAELPTPPIHRKMSIASVAIEESSAGVVARVVAGGGRAATERIRDQFRGTEAAIIGAVASLLDLGAPRIVSAEDRETEGSTVVLVVLEADDGRRVAGSAVVAGGRPFAVARAAHAAMSELR